MGYITIAQFSSFLDAGEITDLTQKGVNTHSIECDDGHTVIPTPPAGFSNEDGRIVRCGDQIILILKKTNLKEINGLMRVIKEWSYLGVRPGTNNRCPTIEFSKNMEYIKLSYYFPSHICLSSKPSDCNYAWMIIDLMLFEDLLKEKELERPAELIKGLWEGLYDLFVYM